MDLFTGLIVILALPGYVALQWYTARSWHGGWRIAALVPLVVMALLVVRAGFAFMAQSNLWPMMVILAAPLACIYLIALAGMRALAD